MAKHRKKRAPMTIMGKPVVNATKPIKLVISAADVRNGQTKDPGACAAAKACTHLEGVEAARVHLGRTYILKGKKWIRYMTSLSLRSEIVAFDRGGEFAAGTYYLLKPTPYRSQGKRQGSDTFEKGHGKKLSRPYHITTGVRVHGAAR